MHLTGSYIFFSCVSGSRFSYALVFVFVHIHCASGSVSIQLAFGVQLKCANVWPQLWHLTSCYRCCRLSLDFFCGIISFDAMRLICFFLLFGSHRRFAIVSRAIMLSVHLWFLLLAIEPTGQPTAEYLRAIYAITFDRRLHCVCIHHRCARLPVLWAPLCSGRLRVSAEHLAGVPNICILLNQCTRCTQIIHSFVQSVHAMNEQCA